MMGVSVSLLSTTISTQYQNVTDDQMDRTTTTTKTFITRKFAEAANARSVDSTEEKRLQSLFEDIQRDVR